MLKIRVARQGYYRVLHIFVKFYKFTYCIAIMPEYFYDFSDREEELADKSITHKRFSRFGKDFDFIIYHYDRILVDRAIQKAYKQFIKKYKIQ